MNTFFEDIAITNRVYCDSLGLPSDVYQRPLSKSEADGVPLSADERLIAAYIKMGYTREQAESEARVGASIQKMYEASRSQGSPSFVGD